MAIWKGLFDTGFDGAVSLLVALAILYAEAFGGDSGWYLHCGS